MARFVALLRGINVGGKNLVKMTELKAAFEALGFASVATYIQSGNVLFEAPDRARAALARRIEAKLEETFGVDLVVVLRSTREMSDVVARAPAGFGTEPRRYRYDVLFLKEPLVASEAIAEIPVREGVDEAHAGDGVIYFSRVEARAAESRLSKIVALPLYKHVTIRNWNTTTKLVALVKPTRPERQPPCDRHGASAKGAKQLARRQQ